MSRMAREKEQRRRKNVLWIFSILLGMVGAGLILFVFLIQTDSAASTVSTHTHSPSAAPTTTTTTITTTTTTPAPSPSPSLAPDPTVQPTEPAAPLVLYQGPVEHIFFHPLLVRPELAFDGDNMSKGFDDWFVTVEEFEGILKQLYQQGYMLVRMSDLYQEETKPDGSRQMKLRPLMLPEGKKPLIISVDDLNYYSYMLDNGTNRKLVLDDQGRIAAEYNNEKGSTVVSRDSELVPMVDQFVEQHPDFSLNGAKGILALTGYEGVLGYRTNDPSRTDYEEEKAGALQMIEKLKQEGWSFASHSWGHADMPKSSLDRIKKDTARWAKEVEPLVGPTTIFIYPYGDRLKHDDPRFQILYEAGFRFYCGVGPTPYLRAESDIVEMDRRHIDGISLKTQSDRLAGLFDAKSVLDPLRPKKPQ